MHHQEHPAFLHETSFDSNAETTVFMVGLVCHLIELLCQKLVLILANLPPTCHLHPVFPRPRSRLALEDAPVPLKPLHMHLYLAGCIHKICI